MTPAVAERGLAARFDGSRVETAVATGVPALLIVGMSLKSGGYPAGIPATAACIVLLLLAARIVLVPSTYSSISWPGAIVAVGLVALTAWAVASVIWSHAPARAVTAGSRDLLYLATFLTFATMPRSTVSAVMRGSAGAIVVVALIALAPRLAPDLFTLSSDASSQRLAWPLSYQNALGLLMAIGVLLALHLTGDPEQPPRVHLATASAVPILVCALYLTQSRGAIGAFAVGLLAWIAIARSRWALAALATVALPALIVLVATYRSVELVGSNPSTAVTGEGHRIALVLIVCVALAAWLRGRARRYSASLAAAELPQVSGRAVAIGLIVSGALVALAGGTQLHDRLDQFARTDPSAPLSDPRSRLVQFTNSGRLDLWRGAAETVRRHPAVGRGADTFQTSWDLVRPNFSEAREAHSLYFETAAELGVVGLILVLGIVAALFACCLAAPGGRSERAALTAVVLVWALHAAVDWDWEMPAVTVILFALAGAARPSPGAATGPARRMRVAALAATVAALPGLWGLSQALSDRALSAFERGDCRTALRRAGGSLALAPFRTEARIVRAACLVRQGRNAEALAESAEAKRWDRTDFRTAYDAALIATATDTDWRPDADRAVALNRHSQYGSWLRLWLGPTQRRPPELVARVGPLLLAGEPYPPVLPLSASPPR